MDFQNKFQNIVFKNNSLLCVGLDPVLEKIRSRTFQGVSFKGKGNILFEFNKSIIGKTFDLVCAYKLNIAFYEAYGLDGLDQLKQTIDYLKKKYSNIPIVLDAKRADIANTAKMYAKSVFEYWAADATTVYPHLGLDSLQPFLNYQEKSVFLLIKTSNPDDKMFQDLKAGVMPYWQKMATKIKKWKYKNLNLFIGATYPGDLKTVRDLFPDKIILTAGIGAQGASIGKAVKAGINKKGSGIIFNASRSIIYSQDPRGEATKLKDEINKYRAV